MSNKSMSEGLEARRAALRLLGQVTRDGEMLGDTGGRGALGARALRLAGLALRHLGRSDAIIADRLERPPAPRTRDVLRLALAEIHAGDGAAHGVVNDAVALAKMSPKTAKQAGLVNAVLRGVTADDWDAAPPPRLPRWLRAPVHKAWGDRLDGIEAAHLVGAPLDLTVKTDADGWAARLGAQVLPTGSLRLPSGQVTALEGYDDGAWWVQDAAAAIPARALGDVSGLRVLDLCAAPGGKMLQLAAAGAQVTALDVSEGRLRRLRRNLERTGLSAEIVVADALDWEPEAPFDAVLLDAPCSATGTIRRHPDLPWRKGVRDVEALTKLQYRLLDRAIGFAAPGGRMVFCTCSLLPVEGEHQVRAALKRHEGLEAVTPEPGTLGLPEEAASPNGLRLLPDLWPELGGMDGFYISVLRRA
ncbi:RsmB/NOP family class I SAM-dependent RNA methyltransferase [Jannaschia aquimarina]|uniref:RsmB/NOP family class I SAM-dependent RNA methyltransferase n=1 Tax=Jannaschia aquimarina TaxID=935700 RepID=UPI001F269E3F|nr:methyltransferase domain-containing protein [Jannaschia aquimarina]